MIWQLQTQSIISTFHFRERPSTGQCSAKYVRYKLGLDKKVGNYPDKTAEVEDEARKKRRNQIWTLKINEIHLQLSWYFLTVRKLNEGSHGWVGWLTDWFLRHAIQPRVILCQEVRELHSLGVRIYIFCVVVFLIVFAFGHCPIEYV